MSGIRDDHGTSGEPLVAAFYCAVGLHRPVSVTLPARAPAATVLSGRDQ